MEHRAVQLVDERRLVVFAQVRAVETSRGEKGAVDMADSGSLAILVTGPSLKPG